LNHHRWSADVFPAIEKAVSFTEWELERVGKMQYIRWHSTTQFYSIDYSFADFIINKNGYWFQTPEGEQALNSSAEEVMIMSEKAHKEMEKNRKNEVRIEDEPSSYLQKSLSN